MSIRTLSFVVTSAALLFAACKEPAKPPTVVPAAPVVTQFSSSASSVAKGGKVTLSWKVENASEVSLVNAATGPVAGVAADAFESQVEVQVDGTSVFILTARGEAGSDTRLLNVAVPGSAASVVFRAVPEEISGGGSATLVWSALGAGAVTVKDDQGQSVDLGGQLDSGSIQVSPSRTTSYTLTAGGGTASATVRVRPAILGFASSTTAAQAGDPVTLTWKTSGAVKVTLAAAGRGDLKVETAAAQVASGSFADTIPASLPDDGLVTYTLTAEGEGTTPVSRQLTVYVGTGIAISKLTVPSVTKAGAAVAVSWQTTAADSVQVLVAGAVRYQTTATLEAINGSYNLLAPAQSFAVTVVARNARGDSASMSATVSVIGAPANPTLSANPTTVAVGAPVTLTYSAPDSAYTTIVDSSGEMVFSIHGAAAGAGTAVVVPSATTTYKLTADNTLGDPVATATVTVTVTGEQPGLVFVGGKGTAAHGSYAELGYAADPAAIVHGIPHSNIQVASSANFIDISGTAAKLQFANEANDAVISVNPGFNGYLFGKPVSGPITVSTNGWMAFNEIGDPLDTEENIPSTSTPPMFVAPFWHDLSLSPTGAVYWQIVGEAPERTLIVQWNKLEVGTDSTTEATFQVQLHQTGALSFQYKTMNLDAPWAWTVGVQGPTPTVGLQYSPEPTSNTALYFFTPVLTPVTTRVFGDVDYGGFLKVNGNYLRLKATRAVRLNSELSITEVNAHPSSGVPQGEWLEIENRSNWPVDLKGWRLATPDAGGYTFDGGVVPARGRLVVGASADPQMNDDAGVAISWDGQLSLNDRVGTIRLEYAPDAATILVYDGGVGAASNYDAGVSFQLDHGPYTFAGSSTFKPQVCVSTANYGVMAQQGTPGAGNHCGFAYALQSIPASYYDIAQNGGTRVFNATTALDDSTVTINIPAGETQPMYFGVSQPLFSVSVNGWLSFSTTTATAPSNKSSPSASSATVPSATVAPFWDDLLIRLGQTPASDVYYKRVAANEDPRNPGGHWIVQWTHLSQDSTSGDDDDLNFQVKLFDDGVIEYHYGTMAPGDSWLYAMGGSATVWLENPTGTQALMIGYLDDVIMPHSAYRFVPR